MTFAEDDPVLVRFPRDKAEEQGSREAWPWLPGTVLEQAGPDEWRVCVEVRELAVRQDGSRPTRRTPPRPAPPGVTGRRPRKRTSPS